MYSLLLLSLVSGSCFAKCIESPTVTIDAGVVFGKTTTLPAALGPVDQFLGIPFAQSPPQRFSPPERPPRFLQPIDATDWKPACIQQFRCGCTWGYARLQSLTLVDPITSSRLTQTIFNNPASAESEDCMYLNVYAPSTRTGRGSKAVLFWVFGGSLQFGNAGSSLYYGSLLNQHILTIVVGQAPFDGTSFAAYEDIIVVTANYRTNGSLPPMRILPCLTYRSVRLPGLSRAPSDPTQSRLPRPALRPRLGPTQHPRFRWRSAQSNNLRRECGWILY
jgi:hypothetical protein